MRKKNYFSTGLKRKVLAFLTIFCLVLGMGGMFVSALEPQQVPNSLAMETVLEQQAAGTQGTTTTLNVWKLAMANFEGYPIDNQNGRILNVAGMAGTPQPLVGIPFKIWKIDGTANAEINAHLDLTGADASANIDWLKGAGLPLIRANATLAKPMAYTNSQGLVAFTGLEQGVYLVEEGDNGAVQQSLAVPFVVTLPMAYTYQYQVAPNEAKNGSILFGTDGNPYYLDVVNVYPKNITTEPTIEKSVENLNQNTSSYTVGQSLPFYLQAGVPLNIEKYNKFEFTDVLSASLTMDTASLKATVGVQMDANGKPQGGTDLTGVTVTELPATMYTGWNKDTQVGTGEFWTNQAADYYAILPSAANGNTLTVAFTKAGLTKVAAAAGGVNTAAAAPLLVSFNAVINEKAVSWYETAASHIKNKFSLDFSNKFSSAGDPYQPNPEEPSPQTKIESNEVSLYEGGQRFVKTNDVPLPPPGPEGAGADPAGLKRLAGAEFKIYEGVAADPGKIVKWTAELIAINAATTTNAANFGGTVAVGNEVILKSIADGSFFIRGLKAQRPEQTLTRRTYSRPDANSPWVVATETNVVIPAFDGKYVIVEDKEPAGYVGPKTPIALTITDKSYDTGVQAAPLQVRNTEKPLIPQTGGIGAAIFVVLGALIMVGGLYSMKKGKKTEA